MPRRQGQLARRPASSRLRKLGDHVDWSQWVTAKPLTISIDWPDETPDGAVEVPSGTMVSDIVGDDRFAGYDDGWARGAVTAGHITDRTSSKPRRLKLAKLVSPYADDVYGEVDYDDEDEPVEETVPPAPAKAEPAKSTRPRKTAEAKASS